MVVSPLLALQRDQVESPAGRERASGRCGRDGEPAEAILFFRSDDLGLRRFFAGTGRVDDEEIERVAEALATCGADDGLSPDELAERTELSKSKVQRGQPARGRRCDHGPPRRRSRPRARPTRPAGRRRRPRIR